MAETLRVKELKSVFTPEQIAVRVRELGVEIDGLYGQEPLVAICVLKGGVIFFSDLVRALHNQNLELDFVRLSSYGKSSASSKHVIFNKDVEVDIRGKHVLIVEDVVDSRQGRSLRLAALVDKRERRQADVKVDFAGFVLNKGFIVGYGLDYAERYRTLPGVCEIIPE